MRFLFPALVFLLSAPVTVRAQDENAKSPAEAKAEEECFPKCRTGYFCHRGECISLCNPPCASDEVCLGEGECAPKEHGAPRLPIAVESLSVQTIDDVGKEIEEEPVPKKLSNEKPKERSEPVGFVGSLGGGASVCASSGGCNTFAKSDFGADVHILAGYRILEWLAPEGGVTYTHLFIADEDENTQSDRTDFLLAVRAGARFFPLGRRHFIEPVLGVHGGYVMSYLQVGGNSDRAHGLSLDYVVGVDFKFTEIFSLGIEAAIYEPIWITNCLSREAQTDDQGNELFAADSGCYSFEGKRDLFFFNFATQATWFF